MIVRKVRRSAPGGHKAKPGAGRPAAPQPFDPATRDAGFSAARCRSALGAAKALSTTPREREAWDGRIKYWEAQLRFAEAREGIG